MVLLWFLAFGLAQQQQIHGFAWFCYDFGFGSWKWEGRASNTVNNSQDMQNCRNICGWLMVLSFGLAKPKTTCVLTGYVAVILAVGPGKGGGGGGTSKDIRNT